MNVHAPSFVRAAKTEEALILVDERNRKTGEGEKLATHRKGLLHRAFSIFLFDNRERILLQRRYAGKYHSGGLWANTCCGHPRAGEKTLTAANRRLGEELGAAARLTFGFRARYETALDHGLTENELVYVYAGRFDGILDLNPEEVSETESVALPDLVNDAVRRPERYAYWLRHYLAQHAEDLARLRAAINR
ncbi:MAG: isopentenyl-diphosphate Delta-isomerase [Methylocystis sp.]|jgi:isopentenyl-diphosphate delta-isomerase|nr:isopentenyl-diphosphate Delta-isomerase [Methylocystis sp.]MCA3589819.1 isopentenyl-diphosphate Delta-isomerase [Methylocystis sp.]MCA3591582.1 isopentenyl-diphosphate Delta-isomerase [Methylocystis sp.]